MSYRGLLDILRANADEFRQAVESEREQPQACPNDGEPLRDGPDGFPHCPFDGWRPDGAPAVGSSSWS
jgi:hypothetical protein